MIDWTKEPCTCERYGHDDPDCEKHHPEVIEEPPMKVLSTTKFIHEGKEFTMIEVEPPDDLVIHVVPPSVPTTFAPFHEKATRIDALGMPVAISESGWYHPTPCCGAWTSIFEDGTFYCKACYEEVDPAYGNVPVEPFRRIS